MVAMSAERRFSIRPCPNPGRGGSNSSGRNPRLVEGCSAAVDPRNGTYELARVTASRWRPDERRRRAPDPALLLLENQLPSGRRRPDRVVLRPRVVLRG